MQSQLCALLLILLTGGISGGALASNEPSELEAQRAALAKEIEAARAKGIGTKPYDAAQAAINADLQKGISEAEATKRLKSLNEKLTDQLRQQKVLHSYALKPTIVTSRHLPAVNEAQNAAFMAATQSMVKAHWNPEHHTHYAQTVVHFKVDRYGIVSDLRLWKSSGFPDLDEAALQAIRDTVPFDGYRLADLFKTENQIDIEFTFDYNPGLKGRAWR